MPKVIENLKEQLLSEAKRQIDINGYARTTIRSVATACGIGVGTVYNYFSSKDMLIASFVLEDWYLCLEEMRGAEYTDGRELLLSVYTSLSEFISKHDSLFSDADAHKSFSLSDGKRHVMLRSQISEIILPVCNKTGENPKFLSEFIAESVICWTVAKKSFDEIYSVIKLLIK